MHRTVTETLNASQGSELELLCPTCLRETAHEVCVSVDVATDWEEHNYTVSDHLQHQIVKCKGCKRITFRQAATNSEDIDYDDEGKSFYPETVSLFPPRIGGWKGIGEDAWHLPPTVRRVYDETSTALANDLPVLTGIGLRALIETVCKTEAAKEESLFAKIDNLRDKGVLTKQGAAILHNIRNLGNAAAHEVKPHSTAQLMLAMEVVEHLLMDVYILPAKAKLEFGNDKAAE